MNEPYIPEPLHFPTVDALSIATSTLLSLDNCFLVELDLPDKPWARVVNFYRETLEELVAQGVVAWPVKVTVIGEGRVALHDHRIPANKYCLEFCEVCCPMELLPLPQRLAGSREIASGRVTYTRASNGIVFSTIDLGVKP